MPRTARAAVGGLCYHVINRDNARGENKEGRESFFGVSRPAVTVLSAGFRHPGIGWEIIRPV